MRGIIENWRNYQDLITDSLWLFDERDSDEKLDFHGAFIPQVAYQLIKRYTAPGDTVLDLFLGSGTTFKVAKKLGRKCIGVDLNLTSSAIRASEDHVLIPGDALSELTYVQIRNLNQPIQLVICHPPYHDIIKFSNNPNDLSNVTPEVFIEKIARLAMKVEEILEPKGICAVIIGDKYQKGELIPLSFYCMQQFNKWMRLKGVVVKNIENNEAKGKNENLWRYRAFKGGFFGFKHEYILIFQKI